MNRRTGEVDDGVVVLRRWSLDDADWYAATAAGDDLIQRYTSESPTLTAEQVREAIATLLAARAGMAGFLIADGGTGQRLGNIALGYENGVGEVSYWLADHARGRGVATRALRLFSDWAFTVLDLRELRLWTHADNAGSRAVAERAGFVRDPGRDGTRQVKGQVWATVAYRHCR